MYNSIIKRSLLILAAIPVVVVLLEIGIRLAVPQPLDDVLFNDIYTETYSPSLNANVGSLSPGMTRSKSGQKFRINLDGNRDYEYPIKKKDGVKRIAIVGSSVSFGYDLALEETFGKQLEVMLRRDSPKVENEVLLFGRPGFKAKETYARLVDRIFDYDPDLIIYSFVQNNYEGQSVDTYYSRIYNLSEIMRTGDSPGSKSLLRKVRDQWGGLKNNSMLRYIRTNFHLYLFSANSIARVLRELSPIEKEKAQNIDVFYPETPEFMRKIKNTETWLSLMEQESHQRGIKFSILFHPYEMQVNQAGLEKWQSEGIPLSEDVLSFQTHQIMKTFSDSSRIHFIDILPTLQMGIGDDEYFLEGDYGHYTASAHKLIATHLSRAIPEILSN
jgi:lysophospholipase L1-like esterase